MIVLKNMGVALQNLNKFFEVDFYLSLVFTSLH